jgi:RNA polymerase sigma-70 factor (ECF subfamily)
MYPAERARRLLVGGSRTTMTTKRVSRGPDHHSGPEQDSTPDSTAGETTALLMPLVYDELRRVAARYVRNDPAAQTIQATALVHEAYLRLAGATRRPWKNRSHFAAISAITMRRVLVERSRARAAVKRGNAPIRLTLDENVAAADVATVDLLALDQALTRLADIDARTAHVVELRFFGGLTIGEAADALDISPATVKREWTIARAWLKRELGHPAT